MPKEVPDLYVNGALIRGTACDVVVELQSYDLDQGKDVRVGVVRMSLQQAKVLAIALTRNIRTMEDQFGQPIPIHPGVKQACGISSEDW